MLVISKWLPFVSVFLAALLLGRWFDMERKKAEALRKPWWTPWRSIPGILIIIAICALVVLKKIGG